MRLNNLQHPKMQMNCTQYNVEQKKPQAKECTRDQLKVQNRQN